MFNKLSLAIIFSMTAVSSALASVDTSLDIQVDPTSPIVVQSGSQPITVTITAKKGYGATANLEFGSINNVSSENPQFSGLVEDTTPKDSCASKGYTLMPDDATNNSCKLYYNYAVVDKKYIENVQTILVRNSRLKPMPQDFINTNFTVKSGIPAGIYFTNVPGSSIHMFNNSIITLNYTLLNNTATQQNFTLNTLPAGFTPTLTAGSTSSISACLGPLSSGNKFVLTAQASCNLTISYDGSTGGQPNFQISVADDQGNPYISPSVAIAVDSSVPQSLGSFANSFSNAIFLYNKNLATYDSKANTIYTAGSALSVIAPQKGLLKYASDGIAKTSYSYVGNSSDPSSIGYIVPSICEDAAKCDSAMKISHIPTAINFDGQYYSDGTNLYQSSNDQLVNTQNLAPSGYSIDALRVHYNSNNQPDAYYVTEHLTAGGINGILMVGKVVSGSDSVVFQQVLTLVLPTLVPSSSAIPPMKLYVDASMQTIVVEQSGAPFLYISSDNGRTWRAINVTTTTGTINDLSLLSLADGRTLMMVAGQNSLAYSLDAGNSWVNISGMLNIPTTLGIYATQSDVNGQVSFATSYPLTNNYSGAIYTLNIYSQRT